MNRFETQNLLNKITIFRQSFLIKKDTTDEWFKVLEPYACEDVSNKLDDFFRNTDNFGLYPDPYCLTKNLTKIIDKTDTRNITIACQICADEVLMCDYQNHYDRCSSVGYICKMAKKYFNKSLDKQKLKEFSDDKFDKLYWNFCDELFKVMSDGLEKHLLRNSILSHKGLNVEFDLEEIIEEKIKGEY